MRRFSLLLPALFLGLLPLLAACDSNDAIGDGSGPAAVTLTVSAGPAAAGKAVASKSASDHVALGSVKLLLKSIRFHAPDEEVEGEGEEPPADDSAADDESGDFHSGPVVVELLLEGGPTPVAAGDLPAGTYDRISFHVHKPRGNETPADPDFAGDSPSQRYSVIVSGTYNDAPFTYRSSLNVVQAVDFLEPLAVEEGEEVTADLEVDVSTWFTDRDGAALDPTDDSPQNRSRIDRSIRDSFRAFRDDDGDGEPDAESGT